MMNDGGIEEGAESSCESNRLRQGCRIQEGRCLCGTGCDTDYRYSNRKECEAALRGAYTVSISFFRPLIIANLKAHSQLY